MKKMNTYFRSLVLFLFVTSVKAQERAFQLGFFPPLSTNGAQAAQYTNGSSLNIIAGVSKSEKYFSLSSFAGIIKENAGGAHIAGFHSQVGQTLSGAQVAGFSSFARKANVQVAGFTSVADSALVQVAGFTSVSRKASAGVQVSGFLNYAPEAQTQVAGFMNVAGKVKGVQLAGFINVADSSDYPIGLINWVKNGEKSIAAYYDETGTALLGLRSGGRVLYGILAFGYTFNNHYAAEGGIGAVVLTKGMYRLKAESTHLVVTKFDNDVYQKSSIRALSSLTFLNKLEIFAGPSLNYAIQEGESLFPDRKSFRTRKKPFIGYTAGIAVKL
jgi:hypothetical protein